MLKLLTTWYRRMQLNALAREYERLASRAERMQFYTEAIGWYREATEYRALALQTNPPKLDRFVVP